MSEYYDDVTFENDSMFYDDLRSVIKNRIDENIEQKLCIYFEDIGEFLNEEIINSKINEGLIYKSSYKYDFDFVKNAMGITRELAKCKNIIAVIIGIGTIDVIAKRTE